MERKATKDLERLKWIHRIKLDAVHRKVMKTLRRFIDEDDMEYDEATESAVEKQKFLLDRVMQEKLLSDESDDDEKSIEEVEASVSCIRTLFWNKVLYCIVILWISHVILIT